MNLKNKETINKHFPEVTDEKLIKCLDFLIDRYPLENILKVLETEVELNEDVLRDLCEKVEDVTKL
jgi:uncharacterized protein (DUF433 family)